MKLRLLLTTVSGIAALSVLTGPALSGADPVTVSPMVFVPTFSATASAGPGGAPDGATTGAAAVAASASVGQTANDATTEAIVDGLRAAQLFCAALVEDEYTIDCLSERLETAAQAMPATGDYAQARTAILDASAKLRQIALANADGAKPRGTASRGGVVTRRPLVAVTRASLPSAAAQAAAVLQEAETVLLRSASGADRRRSHYTRIAAAVGSSKVLLRSL